MVEGSPIFAQGAESGLENTIAKMSEVSPPSEPPLQPPLTSRNGDHLTLRPSPFGAHGTLPGVKKLTNGDCIVEERP